MLQLASAGKRFGHKLLFEQADWLITPDERTGLVGANGTGKSTLLKILAGMETLDYGELNRTRGMTMGYLPQDGLSLSGRTVFDECLSVFAPVLALEGEMQRLSAQLSELPHDGSEYHALSEKFSRMQAEFRAQDGYALDSQVGAVLDGLGFRKEDWSRRVEEFSGGWQMRIALGKLLLEKPDLLLLDEPTNHLDLEARNWLEHYLQTYPKAYILISHDRYFLDVTVRKTVELWNKRIHFYSWNYEKYLAQKAERRAQLEAAYKNQRDQIEHLEAFINRFRYQATKAKQVQSRIKELEKIERIEIPEEEKTIHFHFPQPSPSGRTVVEASGLAKSFGEKRVLAGVNFTIDRGDRIALVGANGAGKSTLIRMLAGLEPATAGSIKLGHNVVLDYFAQDQYKALDPEARMLDEIGSAAPKVAQVELRSLLGCFLFSGDDVFKQIGVLSGGERNRFALARLLVSPANFLLLDEPTNHLDLRAKDVLLEAIRNFTGTVLFVSHDRYFLDALATRVFEVENGGVQVYPGNYEDYLLRKAGAAASGTANGTAAVTNTVKASGNGRGIGGERMEPARGAVNGSNGGATGTAGSETARAVSGATTAASADGTSTAKRLNPIKLRQMRERCEFVEEEIPRLESAIATIEQDLGNYVSPQETQRLTELLADTRDQHATLLAEWEELAMALEEQAALS